MPDLDRIAVLAQDARAWRHDFHAHPELLYEVQRTAGQVAERLRSFGCDEVATGIGRTGVVAVIRGREPSNRSIALRADMDALPITEITGLPYASGTPGLMHACGHDGHTAMLLGAARYLAETRAFAGTAVMVFQPAEEGGAGAKAMLDEGLFQRFPADEVYGMHNMPGLPVGHFALRAGPLMAATDRFTITLEGVGGHAARPHMCVDPLVAGATLVGALQTIASRNADPIESVVVSVTQFHAGSAFNIIPQTAVLTGTVRTLTQKMRMLARARLHAIAEGIAAGMGVKLAVAYDEGYPVTTNHAEQTRVAADVAAQVAGHDNVNDDTPPVMGAEDFSYMLQAKPGAFIFVGNGSGPGLHNPGYDFNDDCIPLGMRYWAQLVETALPLA